MNKYLHNLKAFKELLNKYTIADLKSMIYDIPAKDSGACCYPAIQTLISLMELLGRICKHDVSYYTSFEYILYQLGPKYQNNKLAKTLYELFRHGIAHSTLAKGGVTINKIGDDKSHLIANNGKHIDVRIMFEDFLDFYNNLFDRALIQSTLESYHEENLKKVVSSLNFPWLDITRPDLFIHSLTTTSGTATSGASGTRGPADTFTP